MAKTVEEIVAEMRSNPRGVRYADACRVATHYFGEPRQKGTSHKVWKMPWPGDPRINLQDGSGKAKPYQIHQVIAAIDTLLKKQTAEGAKPAKREKGR